MRDPDTFDAIGQLAGYGRIASVDLAGGYVTVRQGDTETAPIRWVMGGGGKTRVWSRPKVGEQVLVIAPEGDIAGAIALRGVHSRDFPPIADADREMIEFEDGAIVSYDPAQHILAFALPAGATVTIDADVRFLRNVRVDGTIEAIKDVIGDGKSLKDHLHTKVQAGTAISGPPQ